MIGKVLKLQPRLFLITYYCWFCVVIFCTKTMMNQMFMYLYFCEILFGFFNLIRNMKIKKSWFVIVIFIEEIINKEERLEYAFKHFIDFPFLSLPILAPNNFKGLLLRSDVLYRLNHYQSSLADVDNALKSRPSSYKVSKTFTQQKIHKHT